MRTMHIIDADADAVGWVMHTCNLMNEMKQTCMPIISASTFGIQPSTDFTALIFFIYW